MENFFQFLIILLVVISFFRKFFKVPPPPQNPPQRKPEGYGNRETDRNSYPPQRDETSATYTKDKTQKTFGGTSYSGGTASSSGSSNDEYDIMKEIENMFNRDNQRAQGNTAEPTINNDRRTRIEEHSQRNDERTQSNRERVQSESERTIKVQKVDTSYTPSEHEITSFKRKKVDADTERRARAFEESLARKEETLPLFSMNLRDKLRHPATLKDYIIISEILGKPKAFD